MVEKRGEQPKHPTTLDGRELKTQEDVEAYFLSLGYFAFLTEAERQEMARGWLRSGKPPETADAEDLRKKAMSDRRSGGDACG